MGSSNADITSSIVKQSPSATGDVSSATLAVSPGADSTGSLTTPEAETPVGAGAAQITPLILDPATTQSADNALGRKMDATDARRNGAAANIVPTDDSVSSARKDLVAEDTLSDREFSDPASPESGSAEPQARAPTVIHDTHAVRLGAPAGLVPLGRDGSPASDDAHAVDHTRAIYLLYIVVACVLVLVSLSYYAVFRYFVGARADDLE
jgi:hypothetical protein